MSSKAQLISMCEPVRAGAVAIALALVAAITAVAAPGLVDPAGAATFDCQISPPSADYSDEVDASARHARIWRLYQAYFLRQPDSSGLDYWITVSTAGATHVDIAQNFELSQEFKNRYGSLTDSEFLELIYANVLCRTPDGDGFDYWLNFLESGQLNRPEMLIYFAEGDEYIDRTQTAWSFFDDPYAATLAGNGYEIQSIPGGYAVAVDYAQVDFKASHERCSVASINGNWFFTPSSPNPTPIGFAVIDGVQIPGSEDRADRGVFGERIRPDGADDERVYSYPENTHLNSNLAMKDGRVLESWLGFQPPEWNVAPRDVASEWRWAAAGIPLVINGQIWPSFYQYEDTYTHQTGGHSFVGFDKDEGILYFGSVAGKSSLDLINWAQSSGFEDLIKFDGGGSVELNISGAAVIGGTPRDVPLWLGIGC
jgi:hypothetical protein